MQKLLETTQVSQLVMRYIHRLTWNKCIALPASEFRIAVAGLMIANKFSDEYAVCLVVYEVCLPETNAASNVYDSSEDKLKLIEQRLFPTLKTWNSHHL